MRINEIVIIPSAGWLGPGTYTRGHAQGLYAEIDLVDKYVHGLADELDNARVRYRIFETRKAPGLTVAQHKAEIYAGTLVLVCACGWNQAKKVKAAHNLSTVTHTPAAAAIARDISTVMGHWGGLYVFGHRTAHAVPDTDQFFVKDGWGVRLEPVQINGPRMEDYGRWMPTLGRDLGRHLADWMHGLESPAIIQATTIKHYLTPVPRAK